MPNYLGRFFLIWGRVNCADKGTICIMQSCSWYLFIVISALSKITFATPTMKSIRSRLVAYRLLNSNLIRLSSNALLPYSRSISRKAVISLRLSSEANGATTVILLFVAFFNFYSVIFYWSGTSN